MNTRYTLVSLLAAGLFFAGCQSTPKVDNGVVAGDITVNFEQPDKFTDAADNLGGSTSDYVLSSLSDHLKQVAPAYLKAGQKLSVTFNDIDLAGDIPPNMRAAGQDIRVIRPIFSPRQVIKFKLTDASGAVVKEGNRTLSNLNFQADAINPRSQSEPFFYDKQLLTDWLRNEFK
ncbi:DUF3016 domain-containing protein [Oleiharenicola lentus]|uniref:DUF3016 domain-containing protein n=1 Tax=Oleiharenicola lentus TaxID=2508720 RepID=UPI003F681067